MKRKVSVTTSIDLEALEKIEKVSRETGKSVSAIIREAVYEWLKKRGELNEKFNTRPKN